MAVSYPPSSASAAVSAVSSGAVADGAADDTASIAAAITAAVAAGHRRVYLPAGTYRVTGTSGVVFNVSADNVDIYGDGEGKTIVRYGSGQTLTADVTVFRISGSRTRIRDMSIDAGGTPQAALTYGSVNAGGTGYVVGDTITLAGGVFTSAAVVRVTSVSSGVVNGAVLNAAGSGGLYTEQGVIVSGALYSQGSTSGVGTGASFSMTGPKLTLVSLYQGSARPQARNLDLSGAWGLNNAGGECLATYVPAQATAFSTTLGTTIAAGARTVTPASMLGIYPGRILRIGGTAENVAVTSVTAATFTATFANAHASTDAVTGWNMGEQNGLVENVYIHDSRSATGVIVSSSKNVFRNVRMYNVGMNSNQHGFYIQAGGNVFDSCYVEGTSGYSYHDHVGSAAFPDNSGNRYVACHSVNPGAQHLIADSLTADGTDPTVPSGQPLTRYVQIIGCVFKCTPGAPNLSTGVGVVVQTGGALVQGCVFEDAAQNGTWLATTGGSGPTRQVVSGNVFRVANASGLGSSTTGLSFGNNAVVADNQFVAFSVGKCVAANGSTGDCLVAGNQFDHSTSGNFAISVQASGQNNLVITGNKFTQGGSSGSASIYISAAATGVQIANNNATLSSGAHFLYLAANATGQVHDNVWTGSTGGVRYTDCAATLDVYNNNGVMNFANTTTNCMPLDGRAGRLLRAAKAANTYTGKKAVKLDASAACGTGDTQWLGFAPCDFGATNGSVFLAGWSGGQIVTAACSNAWTAGNIAICSDATAGSVKDSGSTTPPASPASYGVFLDTGGAAGDATVLVMKAGR